MIPNAAAVNPPAEAWSDAGDHPALEPGQVHVWRIPLDGEPGTVQELSTLLDAGEAARAERYRFERDRRRFVVARGVLRTLLGRYLGAAPEEIRFRYDRWGKPTLAGPNAAEVQFNLSHSAGLALCAVTRGVRVGVDLEQVRAGVAVDQLALRCFSPGERAALDDMPPPQRPEAFFRGWTRKEAYAKAVGRGLSLAFDQFEVSVAPGPDVLLVATAWDRSEAARWSLRDLAPGPGFVAALAIEAVPAPPTLLRQWSAASRPGPRGPRGRSRTR